MIGLVVHACTPVLERADVLVKPTVFAAVNLTNITADANQTLPGPVGLVRVLDQESEPMPGMSVTFTASRGTLVGATTTTDASGEAAVESWSVGTVAGPATLTATLTNQPAGTSLPAVVFNATINAGPAAAVVVAPPGTSNNQNAAAGTAVAIAPSARVNDQFGNAKAGVVVTFTVLTGGGTLNSSSATTANVTTLATGLATLSGWTLGTTVGSNTLRAAAAGVAAPVTFTATGVAGPVANVAIAPGSPTSQGQTAQAGTNVAVAPAVQLRDQFNNAITTSTTVRFAVATGNGRVLANSGDATGSTSLDVTSSASTGIATVFGWRLGSVGSNTLTVTVPSVGTVTPFTITATGTAGTPATLAIVTETPSSNNQTAIVNATVPVAPGVVVRDANGFGVPGQQVTFTVGASSGTIVVTTGGPAVTSGNVTTDANGVARVVGWRLGNRGANTLTATLSSNPSLTTSFSATGTAGPPASILIIDASDNQSTIANTNTPVPPAVEVRDANGLTVDAGHNMTFAIVTGDGLVSTTGGGVGATTVTMNTDANGVARLGYWKPGTVGPNANTMRASVTSTSSINVLFTASGTVGPPTQMFDVNLPWPFTRQTTSNGGEPKVQVVDDGGNGVSGVTINWTNAGNGNSAVGGTISSTTNAEGIASFLKTQGGTWTANGPLGTTMQLRATAASDPTLLVTFESTIVGAASTTAIIRDAPATVTVNGIVTPSVVLEVRDAGGRPVPGGGFTWSYTTNPGSPGTGTLTPTTGGVDSVGQAGVEWRVSRTAGTNSVQWTLDATGINRLFSTTGVAGPAAAIAINAGNNQTAPRGTAVATAPSVIVRDQFNNLVAAGVSVTFSPASGSGSVTGSPATTVGATGVATVGSWTLGSTAGAQTLNAFVTATPSVTVAFSATATDACSATAHTVGGAAVNGTLASTDCNQVIGGVTTYADLFQIVVPPATTRLMSASLNSTAFGPELRSFIYPPANSFWFNNNTVPSTVTSYYVLAPGSYELAVSSAAATTTGSYTFSTVLNPSMPAGCGNFLVTRNVTVTHSLSSTSCLYTKTTDAGGQVSSRVYLIWLPANTPLGVAMSQVSALDTYLEAYDVTGATRTFIISDDDSGDGTNSVMSIPSVSTSRFIEIRASHHTNTPPNNQSYVLSISP